MDATYLDTSMTKPTQMEEEDGRRKETGTHSKWKGPVPDRMTSNLVPTMKLKGTVR
jgi:hypothetical protein